MLILDLGAMKTTMMVVCPPGAPSVRFCYCYFPGADSGSGSHIWWCTVQPQGHHLHRPQYEGCLLELGSPQPAQLYVAAQQVTELGCKSCSPVSYLDAFPSTPCNILVCSQIPFTVCWCWSLSFMLEVFLRCQGLLGPLFILEREALNNYLEAPCVSL